MAAWQPTTHKSILIDVSLCCRISSFKSKGECDASLIEFRFDGNRTKAKF